MKKYFILFGLIAMFWTTGCISLFSEIHNETHHHHSGSEEMAHRIGELEERVHHLTEVLEEYEDDENEDEDDEG